MCITQELDDATNNFETGHTDSFTGGVLGECNGYDVGSTLDGWEMLIIHTGSDGWIGEYVEAILDDGKYVRCDLNNQMVDDFNSLHVFC